MKIVLSLILFLSSQQAFAVFQPYVQVYNQNTRSYQLVKNCVAPVFMTLQPQPGYTADQTCNCNWNDDGRDLVLTCHMPSGLQVLQTADASVYALVMTPGTTVYVPVPRIHVQSCRF